MQRCYPFQSSLRTRTRENRANKWYYIILVPVYGNAILFQSYWFIQIFPTDILNVGDIFVEENIIQDTQSIRSAFGGIETVNHQIVEKIEEINNAQLPNGNDYKKWVNAPFDKAQAKKLEGYAPSMKTEMNSLFSQVEKDISNIIRAKGVYANKLVEIRAFTNASPEKRTQLKSPNEQDFRSNVNELLALVQGLDTKLSTIINKRTEFLAFLLGKGKQLPVETLKKTKNGGSLGWFAKRKIK